MVAWSNIMISNTLRHYLWYTRIRCLYLSVNTAGHVIDNVSANIKKLVLARIVK